MNHRPTLKDVAREAGVSPGTVSRVLNGVQTPVVITEATRKLVWAAARKVRYRPSAAARAMKSNETRQIGVVLHDAGLDEPPRPHAMEFVGGIMGVLEEQDYTTCLVEMSDVERDLNGMSRVFREHALDGVIVQASLIDAVRCQIDDLVDRCVWLDAGVRKKSNCLWRDEERAGQLAAEALLTVGCTTVLWVFAPSRDEMARRYDHTARRLKGASRVLDPHGITISSTPLDFDKQAAFLQAMERMDAETGILVCEYQNAILAFNLAAMSGRIAGRDYQLACCDDTETFVREFPMLSRASYNRFELGKKAARMMIETLRNPQAGAPSVVSRPEWLAGATAVASQNCTES